jgi:hypothetical protein
VHELFRALGFKVTIHPPVPGTSGHPDFLVERGSASLYVEAATVFSGIVSPSRESRALTVIEDTIARLDASTFWVSLRADRVGTSVPPLRSIRHEITDWVATLDPSELASADLTDPRTWRSFEFRDWVISLRPSVWQPMLRGCPDNRFIGMRTGIGGSPDDVLKLRNALTRKGRHYGTPDKPLVVATLATNGFVGDREATDALFGSQAVQLNVQTGASRIVRNLDGVWVSRRGAARRRISAVLLGVGILPHTVATAWPTLWHHFDPTFGLAVDLPFRTARLVDETLELVEPPRSASDVLALPTDWPGPDPPFRQCQHGPGDHTPAPLARV